MYHGMLTLRLSHSCRMRLPRLNDNSVIERCTDQTPFHRMHLANIPASIPPLPVLLAGIDGEHQRGITGGDDDALQPRIVVDVADVGNGEMTHGCPGMPTVLTEERSLATANPEGSVR